jgi:hypothetical protein
MMRVTIKLTSDTATPAAQRLLQALSPRQLATIVARTGATVYRSHFESLAAERHRSSVKAVAHNFYAEAARSTIGTASGTTAFITVSAPVGLRQRLQGGDIKAVNSFALFIPLPGTPAEGRTPGDFTDQLVIIYNRTTKRGVAKEKGRDGRVLFALRDMVSQQPDPSVVPTTTELSDAFRTAIAKRLQSVSKRSASPPT